MQFMYAYLQFILFYILIFDKKQRSLRNYGKEENKVTDIGLGKGLF